jgi:hypothetical protein
LWKDRFQNLGSRPAALSDRPVMREAALLFDTSETEDAAPHVP